MSLKNVLALSVHLRLKVLRSQTMQDPSELALTHSSRAPLRITILFMAACIETGHHVTSWCRVHE